MNGFWLIVDFILEKLKGGIYDMNKTYVVLLIGLLFFSGLTVVAAEDVDSDAGALRANTVGFFENSFDRLRLAFTFNKENRINRILDMAEKRLAEAKISAESDPDRLILDQEKYDELVAKANEVLADIKDGDDNKSSIKNMERIFRIQNRFEKHRERADEIYTRALERFEMNNASEEKIERFEMFYERALNRSNEMETRILERRKEAIKKHKRLTNMTEDELNDLLSDIEENEGLVQAREKRVSRAQTRIEIFEDTQKQRIGRIQAHLNDSALSEEKKAQIQKRLESTQQKMVKFREKAIAKAEARININSQGMKDRKNVFEKELARRGST